MDSRKNYLRHYPFFFSLSTITRTLKLPHKNSSEIEREREKKIKIKLAILVQEYLVAERSKFLSLSLPLPPDTASVSRVGDNAIFLGFPRIFHAGAIGTEEMRGHEKRESGKMQRGEEGKGGRHVERRQQRGARFTRCPRGTH